METDSYSAASPVFPPFIDLLSNLRRNYKKLHLLAVKTNLILLLPLNTEAPQQWDATQYTLPHLGLNAASTLVPAAELGSTRSRRTL